MTRLLPAQLLLGPYKASWIWRTNVDGDGVVRTGGIPAAVLIDHGDHTSLVAWARYDGGPTEEHAVFTMTSLLPLTIEENVRCSVCGLTGRIVAGAWIPLEGGDADE